MNITLGHANPDIGPKYTKRKHLWIALLRFLELITLQMLN